MCLLLSHGADVNARDDEDDTPLILACSSYGFTPFKLLERIMALDKDGATDLFAINKKGTALYF